MSHKLSDLLPAPRIVTLKAREKTPALQSLLDVLASTGAVRERVAVEHAIMSREIQMSTGVGYGIAIPHAKLGNVESFALALGISQSGIAYGSLVDDLPVKLICMVVGPSSLQEDYLRILAMVMRFLKSEKGKILSAFDLAEVAGFTRGYESSGGGPSSR
jgi:nitrogen PTS system EIIA component